MEKQIVHSAKFKLVCAYSHKFDGTPYTLFEKYYCENIINYISNDYAIINEGTVIVRHDMAFLQMIEHVYRKWKYIDNCCLFMNDFIKHTEQKIGVWDKADFNKTRLAKLILEKRNLNVLCLGIEDGIKVNQD